MNETLNKIVADFRVNGGNVISLLQETQEAFGYIPREAVDYFTAELGIAPSRFYGVATFYAQFRLHPRGKNIITACCGTACHVKGSERILNNIKLELKLSDEVETTEDNKFSLEKVNCVGACGIAPVVMINNKVHGKTSADKVIKEIRLLKDATDAKK